MRLSESTRAAIVETVKKYDADAAVFLFGSRTDDSGHGGDIDLYILKTDAPHFLDKPRLLAALKRELGEQKIDIVFGYAGKKQDLIDCEALGKGVRL